MNDKHLGLNTIVLNTMHHLVLQLQDAGCRKYMNLDHRVYMKSA